MRQAAPIFDAAQAAEWCHLQQGRAGIEHAVDGVRPIFAVRIGLAGMPKQQWFVASCYGDAHKISRNGQYISVRDRSHEQSPVDSALFRFFAESAFRAVPSGTTAWIPLPDFRLTRSGCKPSRQPPVHGIVERKLQIVVAQEPVESRPGFAAPAIVSGYAIRLQTGGHRARGFNRLLIEARLFATLAIKPLRADRHKVAVGLGNAAFPSASPAIRVRRRSCVSHPEREPASSMACGSLALP